MQPEAKKAGEDWQVRGRICTQIKFAFIFQMQMNEFLDLNVTRSRPAWCCGGRVCSCAAAIRVARFSRRRGSTTPEIRLNRASTAAQPRTTIKTVLAALEGVEAFASGVCCPDALRGRPALADTPQLPAEGGQPSTSIAYGVGFLS